MNDELTIIAKFKDFVEENIELSSLDIEDQAGVLSDIADLAREHSDELAEESYQRVQREEMMAEEDLRSDYLASLI